MSPWRIISTVTVSMLVKEGDQKGRILNFLFFFLNEAVKTKVPWNINDVLHKKDLSQQVLHRQWLYRYLTEREKKYNTPTAFTGLSDVRYSKPSLIRHLCNPCFCIIRRWFPFPFDHFLCFFALFNPTTCLFWHKMSLPVRIRQVPLYFVWFASYLFQRHGCESLYRDRKRTKLNLIVYCCESLRFENPSF